MDFVDVFGIQIIHFHFMAWHTPDFLSGIYTDVTPYTETFETF